MPSQEVPDPKRFSAEQWLPHPVEVVFAFFAQPENLPRLAPRWQKLRIEEAMFRAPAARPPSKFALRSFAAGAGTQLTVSFRPFPLSPLRLPWRLRITEFDWNDHFCDEQDDGPFRYWRHCHSVKDEQRDGTAGTLLRDRVEYALPLEPVSTLFDAAVLRPMLRRMFAYRQRRTAELLALAGGAARRPA